MSAKNNLLDGFLARRIHSLLGVVPIGIFMIIHLTTNSSVVWGALNSRANADTPIGRGVKTFQHEVDFINNLPLLLLTEIFVLWVPIGLHAILGVYYATSGKSNVSHYSYQSSWRYSLQRLTAWLGLLFVVYHVATLRWGWTFLIPGDAQWSHYFASSTLAAAMKGSADGWTIAGIIVSVGYFVGVMALVFHLANGLWTAAITWGLTVTEKAQKRWGAVCTVLGLGLAGAGASAIFGFLFLADYEDAHHIESGMVIEKYGEDYYLELLEKYDIPINPETGELETGTTNNEQVFQDAVREAANRAYPGPPKPLAESNDG
ncbi:MAG: hypothetical protein AAGB34_02960 [Planctomycetota bacterium]